jgi:glycerol uptake facilitator-like aquaporin
MTDGARVRLKCRERDLFAELEKGSKSESTLFRTLPLSQIVNMHNDKWLYLNHFIIEFMASVVLMYSCVYVPENGNDYMKQYVSSLAIFAVILTIKDGAYFCPDGTPMATFVLAASGAYTSNEKKTDWPDIFIRIAGQLIGWALVCFVVVGHNKPLFSHGVPEFKYKIEQDVAPAWGSVLNELAAMQPPAVDETPGFRNNPGGVSAHVELHAGYAVVNEFVATFIECVAISFMVMPLLKSYPAADSSQQNIDPGADAKLANAFRSKTEAMPPKNKDIWFAASCLAVLHYILERTLRTTMNPFVYGMHRYAVDAPESTVTYVTVLFQMFALVLACFYCYFLLPSQKLFMHIQDSTKP